VSRPILITGAGGQVGGALARLAREADLFAESLRHAELDIGDRNAVIAAVARLQPTVVVNCAAYTDVDGAEERPELAQRVNGEGPGYLARACETAGIPLVHLSTDYVFDGTADRPYREDDPTGPLNMYGRTKLAGEHAVRNAAQRHLIIRTSWVFAAGYRNFATSILDLARTRIELRVVADQIGSPTPAVALARQLLDLARRTALGEDIQWGTYHLAGRPPASRYELAMAVIEAARASGDIACQRVLPVDSSAFPTRAARPANTALDTSHAVAHLGLEPIRWSDGVADVVRPATSGQGAPK